MSSAEVASSRRRIFGFLTIARAIATRCFSPPLNCVPLSPTFVSYPCHRSSTASKVITYGAVETCILLWLLIITFSPLLLLLSYYPYIIIIVTYYYYYCFLMPLGVKIPGLKQSLKTDKKAGKARGPVGRRINQRFLESKQRWTFEQR